MNAHCDTSNCGRDRKLVGSRRSADAMSASGPGCVKTSASRECAELLSPFSSCDCQCCSFPIQRNRDKISTRKFAVGVFTQPGSIASLWERPVVALCGHSGRLCPKWTRPTGRSDLVGRSEHAAEVAARRRAQIDFLPGESQP